MNIPQISIVVPIYKVEEYLTECIDSILSQTFTDFELLLIDDGSPDNSGNICDIYAEKDARIKVIHQNNMGASAARNTGIEASRGAFLTFVDSDDVLTINALETLYFDMEQSGAEVVLGKVQRFVAGQGTRPYTRLEERREMTGREALILILQGVKINISACGALYKRKLFENLRMPVGYICEDWYITPSLYLQTNKVIFNPALCYFYRDNPQSTMRTMQKRCNPQIIDVAEHVIRKIKIDDEDLYYYTLWSNLKRVWKYVGIVYSQRRQKEEQEFLTQVRTLLKSYWGDLVKSGQMKCSAIIGIWSFCYCVPLCSLLYFIKNANAYFMTFFSKIRLKKYD